MKRIFGLTVPEVLTKGDHKAIEQWREQQRLKRTKEFLINRENKSIGLRSIGEIMSYNRICDPMYSFLVSDKGHSNEISYFMINETFRDKLIKYNDKSLILFSFEEDTTKVKENSVIPPNLKDLLSE